MPPQKIIFAIEAAAYAFTAWRLFARGVARRQIALFGFLVFRCALTVTMSFLVHDSDSYFWLYVVTTPVNWIVSILAVRETIKLVLEEYPGLETLGRWTLWGAVAVATIACVVVTGTYWRGAAVRTNLYYVEVATQCLVFGLGVVVASLLIFMSHFPLRLTWNRLVSSIAFGTVVLAEAVTLFIDSTAEHFNLPIVDMTSIVFGAACVVVWGSMLRRHEAFVSARRTPNENDARLLQQLASMERALGGIGRTRV